jgi:hypothetical protein
MATLRVPENHGDVSLSLSAFTQEQLARLKESIEQVKRGELIPESEIDCHTAQHRQI